MKMTTDGIPLDPTDQAFSQPFQVLPMVAGNSLGTNLDGEIDRKHLGDPDLPGRSLWEVPPRFLRHVFDVSFANVSSWKKWKN